MKLYLSSYRIPDQESLAELLGTPISGVTVALIPNAKDYYSQRARDFKVNDLVAYMQDLGLKVDIVDLREYSEAAKLKAKLATYQLIWAMGGNTYILRYEMRRSGFDQIIGELLENNIVYGGDSAGALVAGESIEGVELADEPAFAEQVISEGLGLVPFVILPHADNPEFAAVMPVFRNTHKEREIIELKDSEVVVFDESGHYIVSS